MSTALIVFRRDLRLVDNPAWSAACAAHAQVIPIYIHAPGEDSPWSIGSAGRWWLHHSLAALDRRAREVGSTERNTPLSRRIEGCSLRHAWQTFYGTSQCDDHLIAFAYKWTTSGCAVCQLIAPPTK